MSDFQDGQDIEVVVRNIDGAPCGWWKGVIVCQSGTHAYVRAPGHGVLIADLGSLRHPRSRAPRALGVIAASIAVTAVTIAAVIAWRAA